MIGQGPQEAVIESAEKGKITRLRYLRMESSVLQWTNFENTSTHNHNEGFSPYSLPSTIHATKSNIINTFCIMLLMR